jgi:hypothetical protein
MTNHKDREPSYKLQFTREELETLQHIVQEWLQLQMLAPPFPKAVQSVLEKVGVADFLKGPELEAVRRATRPPVPSQL